MAQFVSGHVRTSWSAFTRVVVASISISTSIPGRTQFLRGRTDSGAVAVVGGPGSHLAVTAADADVLIEIDATTTRVNADQEVRTWPLT
ncbi:hypothetical protein BST26_18700, partial [Mycolicibacterium insubricum]